MKSLALVILLITCASSDGHLCLDNDKRPLTLRDLEFDDFMNKIQSLKSMKYTDNFESNTLVNQGIVFTSGVSGNTIEEMSL
jgi:hypothetical protein